LILASASSRAFSSATTLNFSTAPATSPTLVLAAEAGQHHREIPAGEFFHRDAEGAHRTGNREDRERAGCDQAEARRQCRELSDIRSTDAASAQLGLRFSVFLLAKIGDFRSRSSRAQR